MQSPAGVPHPALAARADAAIPSAPAAPAGQPPPAANPASAFPGAAQVASQGALAGRTDGTLVADRAALQSSAAVPANPAAPQTTAPPPAATLPATPAVPGNPQATNVATNPLAQQAVPPSQAATEARGNTVMPGADRGTPRTDGPLPQGHTVEAGQRRTALRGLGATLLTAWGRSGGDNESAIRRQADYVFQWLYWALTITAWLCLGLLIVAVTPLFGPDAAASARGPAPLGMIAILAGIGLCAGLTAWLVSRRDGRH